MPRLEKALPNDLGDLYANSVNYGFKDYDSLKMYNSSIDKPSIAMGGVPRGQPGFILRVNRQSFRNFLSNRLNVSTKSNFTHYVENADGVTAIFQDGTRVQGTLLVGADGARSRVRNQLLGEQSKSELSKWFPLFAEGKVPKNVYTMIQTLGNAALAYSGPRLNFFAGIRAIEPDGTAAECYWSVYWTTDDPAAEAAWSEKASKQELFDRAQEHLTELPSPLKALVDTLGQQAMTVPPVRYWEWAPPENLPVGRITLLGDALHTMVPFQSSGANTALKDACDLVDLLVQNLQQQSPIPELLQRYAEIALPRGRERVKASHASGEVPGLSAV